jgi:hypothetical protein
MLRSLIAFFVTVVLLTMLGGCVPSYYPTFSEDSLSGRHINDLRLVEVAIRIKCELYEFFSDIEAREKNLSGKEKLAFIRPAPKVDAVVEMQIKTDETGAIAYQGVDLNKIGLGGLIGFIAQKNNAPLFNTSISGNSIKIVAMSLLLPQNKVALGKQINVNECNARREFSRGINKLFIKEWLDNYMGQISMVPSVTALPSDAPPEVRGIRPELVSLTTEFHIIVDVNAGIDRVLIIPTKGTAPTASYKANFSHTLKITLNFTKKDTIQRLLL